MNPFANLSTDAKKTFKIGGAVLIVTIVLFLLGKHCNLGCNRTTTTVTHDTIVSYRDRTDTLLKEVAHYVPQPYKVIEYHLADTGNMGAENWIISDGRDYLLTHIDPLPTDDVHDISYYHDSLRVKDQFKAVIIDTVQGRILGRSVQWADLTPITVLEEKTTITKTKSSLIKVYLGADGTVPVNNILLSRFDLVPGAAFVFADQYMVDVGYGIFGQQVHAGLKVKLSFKKH